MGRTRENDGGKLFGKKFSPKPSFKNFLKKEFGERCHGSG
jgi:hypothetical protein